MNNAIFYVHEKSLCRTVASAVLNEILSVPDWYFQATEISLLQDVSARDKIRFYPSRVS